MRYCEYQYINKLKQALLFMLCLILIVTLNNNIVRSQTKIIVNNHLLLFESGNTQGKSKYEEKEIALRKALNEIRIAIKEYKWACESGMIGPLYRKKDDKCYPPTLGSLVEGVKPPGKEYYIVFLKELPIDPIIGKQEWGLRSIQDDKASDTWGGQNVCNVYSTSEAYASDWTRYKDW